VVTQREPLAVDRFWGVVPRRHSNNALAGFCSAQARKRFEAAEEISVIVAAQILRRSQLALRRAWFGGGEYGMEQSRGILP